jgi:hypothetical protein
MAKTKKTEIQKTETTPVVKHSVPTAGERKMSVGDRLRKKVKPTTKSVRDQDRAQIQLDKETQARFIKYACEKELFDLVDERKSQSQKQISEEIFEQYVEALWRSKSQPQNPSIKAENSLGKVDAEGLFIVSGGSKIKINMQEAMEDEEPEETLVRSLTQVGVRRPNAERIVNNEISFLPQWSLGFTDMIRGDVKAGKIVPPTPTQKTAAEILLCVLNGEDIDGNPLDSAGRAEMLEGINDDGWFALRANMEARTTYPPMLVDSSDFLDRICGYADTKEELRSILTVFTPVYYCSRVKFAVEDSLESKKERLHEEAKSAIGIV